MISEGSIITFFCKICLCFGNIYISYTFVFKGSVEPRETPFYPLHAERNLDETKQNITAPFVVCQKNVVNISFVVKRHPNLMYLIF